MEKLLGYILLLAISVIFFTIYIFLIRIEKQRIVAYYKKQKEKVYIVKDLIALNSKIKKKSELESYPNLAKYLSQVEDIIATKGFNIEDIEISTLRDIPDELIKNFDKVEFSKEYSHAPAGIYNLVNSCSEILGRIYRLNHPIQYFIIEFKKNLLLQKLRFLIKIYEKMLKSEKISEKMPKTDIKKATYSKTKSVKYNFINEPLCA